MSCNKRICAGMLAALVLLAGGCRETDTPFLEETSGTASSGGESATPVTETVDGGEMFTDRDLQQDYDPAEAVAIGLEGDTVRCEAAQVTVDGSTATITAAGTYRLSGSLSNGRVVVDADKTAKVQLVLDGVDITCATSAAIYVRQADKVFVTLAEGSRNTLANTAAFVAVDDNNIDAVLFSREDLTLNGGGSLTVTAAYGHGIVSKDDLVITGGNYTVTAAGHGIAGKDSLRVAGGTLALTAGKDGLHAENADDATLGFLYVADGTFTITAEGDGLSASAGLQWEQGSLTVCSGGGSANAVQKAENMFGPGGWSQSSSATSSDTTSAKGLKSTGDMLINGGTIQVDAADDALHSNADLTVAGGRLTLASGDDGIHADESTLISGGTLTISDSYEGVEGHTIDITGGSITLTASDDGLNAAGGNDQSGYGGGMRPDTFATDADAYIRIAGGTLVVDADGDGVDSNGGLYVSGGETYVSGPTNGGNGALDYNGEATITGGIFVATGTTGMAQNFGNGSTQGAMLVNTGGDGAGQMTLQDSDGNTLLSRQLTKSYNSIVISCPGLQEGGTYTLTVGGQSVSVTMTSLIYGSQGGMGGGMGGGMMVRP